MWPSIEALIIAVKKLSVDSRQLETSLTMEPLSS